MKKIKSTHPASRIRKRTVVKAAIACFTEKGFEDTGIGDICLKSGASVGSIYHHFKSKEGVAAAAYLEGIRDYQKGFAGVLDQNPGAREGLSAIVHFHLKWVEKNPDWARFLFHQRHAGFMDETKDDFNRLNAEFFARVSAWFRKHINSGAIKRLTPDLYISILLGPCQEYSRLFLSGFHGATMKDAAKEIGKAAWHALKDTPPTRMQKTIGAKTKKTMEVNHEQHI